MAASEKQLYSEDDESTASENEDGGTEQLFSNEKKKQIVPVQVTKVVQPNKMILKLQNHKLKGGAFGGIVFDLGHQFYSFQTSTHQVKEQVEFKRKMQVVVHTEVTEGGISSTSEDEEEDDLSKWTDEEDYVVDEIDAQFHRGVILHSISSGFTVFLYDIGVIKDVSIFEISPLEDEALLAQQLPPRFILMTIPGIVPRDKRLDTIKIPGLKLCDIQASEWTPESVKDVEHWISKQKVILFSELMPICSECLVYGDLYGATEPTGPANAEPLSKYLTRKRNVFFEYKFLKQIYSKECDDLR